MTSAEVHNRQFNGTGDPDLLIKAVLSLTLCSVPALRMSTAALPASIMGEPIVQIAQWRHPQSGPRFCDQKLLILEKCDFAVVTL